MSEKRVISIDSTILNTFQMCARKAQYNFEENLQPPIKAEPLERGDLLHKMMELYYGLTWAREGEQWVISDDNDTIVKLVEANMLSSNVEDFSDWAKRVKFAVEAGRYFSTKMELGIDEVEETIFQFGEYAKHFRYDTWRPLAVEEVGSKKIHEDEETIIVYNFKIDLIMEKDGMVIPWDHKTSRRAQSPSSLSNQFIGYAFGIGASHVIVNKIGFQKTKKPSERFLRDLLTYDAERIEEWLANTIWWTQMYDHHKSTNEWPMNLTSCDKYSGCIYSSLCEQAPSGREWVKQRQYIVGRAWDVASILEANK